jgi:large subunit ribosomal protein L36
MCLAVRALTHRYHEEVVMKVRSSLRSLKNRAGSVVIRRHGRVVVVNRTNPRLKARQG